MAQDILQHQHGVHGAVAVGTLQILEEFLQAGGVGWDIHLLLVGGENRIFLPPQLGPVDFFLGFLAGVLDYLPDFRHICVEVDELIQGEMVQDCQTFGLADVRQCLVCFP